MKPTRADLEQKIKRLRGDLLAIGSRVSHDLRNPWVAFSTPPNAFRNAFPKMKIPMRPSCNR
ncbi:MAG: hypothetical protein KGR98_05920 [Verrucomicrobia bacterium]|nr:hypothetical protein [Verrucomicrobiota bacterium]